MEKYRKASIFLIAKAFRIYPTYIVGFSITFFVIWVYTYFNGIVFPYNALDWLEQVTLIHGFIWKPSIDQISWTLVANIEFYILIAILMFFKCANLKGFVKAGAFLTAVAFITSAGTPIFGETGKVYLYYAGNIITLACFCVTYMLIGAVLYEFYANKSEPCQAIGCLVFLYGCFIACCVSYSLDARIYIGSYSFSLAIFMLCMMLYKRGYCNKLFDNNEVSFVARISYSLYIVHGLNGYILETTLLKAGINKEFVFPITVIVVFIVAILLNSLIERPIGKITDRFLSRL